jgi:hypothetical protein
MPSPGISRNVYWISIWIMTIVSHFIKILNGYRKNQYAHLPQLNHVLCNNGRSYGLTKTKIDEFSLFYII